MRFVARITPTTHILTLDTFIGAACLSAVMTQVRMQGQARGGKQAPSSQQECTPEAQDTCQGDCEAHWAWLQVSSAGSNLL